VLHCQGTILFLSSFLAVSNTNNSPAEIRKFYHKHTTAFLSGRLYKKNYLKSHYPMIRLLSKRLSVAVDNLSQFE